MSLKRWNDASFNNCFDLTFEQHGQNHDVERADSPRPELTLI